MVHIARTAECTQNVKYSPSPAVKHCYLFNRNRLTCILSRNRQGNWFKISTNTSTNICTGSHPLFVQIE